MKTPFDKPQQGNIEVTFQLNVNRDWDYFGNGNEEPIEFHTVRFDNRDASSLLVLELDECEMEYTIREFIGESWHEVVTYVLPNKPR